MGGEARRGAEGEGRRQRRRRERREDALLLTGLTLSLMSCHGLICGEPSLSCPRCTEKTDQSELQARHQTAGGRASRAGEPGGRAGRASRALRSAGGRGGSRTEKKMRNDSVPSSPSVAAW
eukprot:COSAG06_NODE_7025_length_2669_cov_382.745525_2_plen_121_part_00